MILLPAYNANLHLASMNDRKAPHLKAAARRSATPVSPEAESK